MATTNDLNAIIKSNTQQMNIFIDTIREVVKACSTIKIESIKHTNKVLLGFEDTIAIISKLSGLITKLSPEIINNNIEIINKLIYAINDINKIEINPLSIKIRLKFLEFFISQLGNIISCVEKFAEQLKTFNKSTQLDVIAAINNLKNIFTSSIKLFLVMALFVPLMIPLMFLMPRVGIVVIAFTYLFKILMNSIVTILSHIDADKVNDIHLALSRLTDIFKGIRNIIKLLILMIPALMILPVFSLRFHLFFLIFRTIIRAVVRTAKAAIPILSDKFGEIFIKLGELLTIINTHVKITPIITVRLQFLLHVFRKIIAALMEICMITLATSWFFSFILPYVNLVIKLCKELITNIVVFIDEVFRAVSFGRSAKLLLLGKFTLDKLKRTIRFANEIIKTIIKTIELHNVGMLLKYVIHFRVTAMIINALYSIYNLISGIMFGTFFFKMNTKMLLSLVTFIKTLVDKILKINLVKLIKARKILESITRFLATFSAIMPILVFSSILAIPAAIAAAALLLSMTVIILSIKGIVWLFKLINQKEVKKINRKLREIMLLMASVILICTVLALFAVSVTKISKLILIGLLILVTILILLALVIKTITWIFSKSMKLKNILSIILVLAVTSLVIVALIGISMLLVLLQEQAKQIDILTIVLFIVGFIVFVAILVALGHACVLASPILIPAGIAILLVVASLLLIAHMLNMLGEIKIDTERIRENVSCIMETAAAVISAIFDSTDDKNPTGTSKGFIKVILGKLMTGSAKLIEAILAIAYLALIIVSVLLISFIAVQLKLLQTLDLDPEKIKKSVSVVLNTAKSVVNSIFDATDDKEEKPSSKEFFSSLLNFCCPQLSAIFNAIMSMGYLALVIVAIFLINFIAVQLRLLQTLDLDPEKIKNNISTVLSTANSCIDSIFQPDDTKKQPAKGSIKNILKWVLGDNMVALIDALMSIGYLAIVQTAVGMLGKMARDLTAIAKLPSMDGVDKKVFEIVNASKNVVNSVFNGNIEVGEIKKLSEQADEAEKYLKKLILIPNSLNQISIKLKSINNIDSSVLQKTNKSIQDMLVCITAPFEDDKKQLNLSKVNAVLKIIQHMNKMLVMQQKSFDNSNNLLKNYSDFITKIDNADLAKLQTTVKIFEQMAKFSESINGNFDQLAETINEKIAPLLEELKESMSKVAENSDRPTDVQAEKISIKNQMKESGQIRNMTDREIDNKVNNKYNEQQQQKLGIDEITEKLTALINLFQSGEAIVRTS